MATAPRIIVSNNRKIKDSYSGVEFIDGDLQAVLIKARDYIHKGYRLINHPMSANLFIEGNPFRSLVLEEGNGLDYGSLKAIETALKNCRKRKINDEEGCRI